MEASTGAGEPRPAACVLGVAAAVGLLAVLPPWLPATDLSLHEGMVALLVHHGDPGFAPPVVYVLSLGHHNQLFYLLAWPLALAFGSRMACKLAVATTLGLTFFFAARLATYLGRSRWAALAVCPAAVGWAFYHGFVPQMLGVALWMGALPLLDLAARRASLRSVGLASVATAALGWAHVASMACACLAGAVFAAARPIDRRTPLRLAPVAVGVALALGEMRWESREATTVGRLFASRVLWHPVGTKLRTLGANLVGGQGLVVEGSLALLVVVAAVLWRRPDGPDGAAAAEQAAPWIDRHRFALVAVALGAAYLAAPYSVNFGALLYVRFLAPAYVLGVLLLGPRRGARGPIVYAPAVALLVAPLLAAMPQVAAACRQFSAVEPLLARIDEGSAVGVLHFGKHDRSICFDATSLGNRVLAERGGRLLASFAEYPIAPVKIRPEVAWGSLLLRLSGQPGALRPAVDLARLRWLLVHVVDASLVERVVRALAPEGHLVAAEGEWLLFRSTLPPLPLTAPDDSAPSPAETLEERVLRQARVSRPEGRAD